MIRREALVFVIFLLIAPPALIAEQKLDLSELRERAVREGFFPESDCDSISNPCEKSNCYCRERTDNQFAYDRCIAKSNMALIVAGKANCGTTVYCGVDELRFEPTGQLTACEIIACDCIRLTANSAGDAHTTADNPIEYWRDCVRNRGLTSRTPDDCRATVDGDPPKEVLSMGWSINIEDDTGTGREELQASGQAQDTAQSNGIRLSSGAAVNVKGIVPGVSNSWARIEEALGIVIENCLPDNWGLGDGVTSWPAWSTTPSSTVPDSIREAAQTLSRENPGYYVCECPRKPPRADEAECAIDAQLQLKVARDGTVFSLNVQDVYDGKFDPISKAEQLVAEARQKYGSPLSGGGVTFAVDEYAQGGHAWSFEDYPEPRLRSEGPGQEDNYFQVHIEVQPTVAKVSREFELETVENRLKAEYQEWLEAEWQSMFEKAAQGAGAPDIEL